jgi:hypothetical protein
MGENMTTITLSTLLTEGLRSDGNALSSLDRAKLAWLRISERASDLAGAKASALDAELGKVVSEAYGEKALPKGWASILIAFGKFFLKTAPVKENDRFTALDVWRKMVSKGDHEIVEALIATATTQQGAWSALCAKPKVESTVTDKAKAEATAKVFPRSIKNLETFFAVPRTEWSTEMLMVEKQMEVFIERCSNHS